MFKGFRPFVRVPEEAHGSERGSAAAKALAHLASPPRAPPRTAAAPFSPSARSLQAMHAEVWVRGEDGAWVAGRVEKQKERANVLVRTSAGNLIEVDVAKGEHLLTVNPTLEKDMTSLWYLHEPGILHNLRGRYEQDDAYTSVAHLLIAVNPLKFLANPELTDIAEAGSLSTLDPHPYVLAEMAYRELLRTGFSRRSQSIVVSGESGAGKTESSKILMRYLAWRAAAASAASALAIGSEPSFSLNERILESNPILESLGNSKTQRNHNSSRFGKYIRLQFSPSREGQDDGGIELLGAKIDTYLLEQSRLISQQKLERNFHIFYELFAGASRDQLVEWKLEKSKPNDFTYLSSSGCIKVEQHDDRAGFLDFTSALRAFGLADESQSSLLRCLTGLLHLGNVHFAATTGEPEHATISNDDVVETSAKMLGLASADLRQALTSRTVVTQRGTESERFVVQLDAQQAAYTRDCLSKAAYMALFEWVVAFINDKICPEDKLNGVDVSTQPELFIGILDIFGFECFATNSFEQLLINFANEKLQATFNQHVFSAEQELYRSEGISWRSVSWPDNSGAISLIAQRERGAPTGLLHLLDEACRLPKSSDAELAMRFHDTHGGVAANPHFPSPDPRMMSKQFIVAHYAGEVNYEIQGFLEKNNGSLHADLSTLCRSSSHDVLADIFKQREALNGMSLSEASTAPETARKPGTPHETPPKPFSPILPTSPKANEAPRIPKLNRSFLDCSESPTRMSVSEKAAVFTPRQDSSKTLTPRQDSSKTLLVPPAVTPRESFTSRANGRGNRSFESIGLQFARQMNAMVAELNTTRCNFIRCIKPNAAMEPGIFDAAYTVVQLRQTGMLQCCELLKHGYPTRIAYAEVVMRYSPVLPQAIVSHPALADGRRFTGAILYGFEVDPLLYQLGESRVFFRAGGVMQIDMLRQCDMEKVAPRLIARVKRYINLKRYRLALAHARMGLALCGLLKRVRALARWRVALSTARIYCRSLLKLLHRARTVHAAITVQSFARMRAPRAAFLVHAQALYEERRRRKQAALEAASALRLQAAYRGHASRVHFKTVSVRRPAALHLQRAARRLAARRTVAAMRERLVKVLIPSAGRIQRWWRVVVSECLLRKLRSVVDRYTDGHRRLVSELLGLLQAQSVSQEEAERKVAEAAPRGASERPKRFEMWVSLCVGLPDHLPCVPAFQGSQVYSARTMSLKRAGGYFASFFSDTSNVDVGRDSDGHYLVPRSWKHFDAIIDYIRDGSCSFPKGYTPTTLDNRPASTEEQELLEFARELSFYGLTELLHQAIGKLVHIRYGCNSQMKVLLKQRGLPIG